VLVVLALVVLALVVALAILALVTLMLLILALIILVRAARAPRRRGARLGSRRNHSPLRGPSLGRRQWTSGPV
jgi:hypothetical protein